VFWIYTDNPPNRFRLSVVDYRALEADHPTFSAMAAYQTNRVTVTDAGAAERVTSKVVTGSYFPLLGQTARIGRLFDVSDDGRDDRSIVLTDAYWARRYARDPSVLGRSITVDGLSDTVVGVLEPTSGPLEHDVAFFTVAHGPAPARKGPFFTMVLGRLRPGMSTAAAGDALRATNARLFPIWRSSYQDEKATWGLQDLKSRIVGDVGSTLVLVLVAVGGVLLIACANAVNLLVARAIDRARELAIREALGASRGRLLQCVMAESAVLTTGAAGVAIAVAWFAVRLVTTYGGPYIPRLDEVTLSGPVVGWLAILSVVSGLFIGVVPAIHGSRLRVNGALRASGRSVTDGPVARRVRRALVAAEFALATPLIVAAVLIMTSLDRLGDVRVGIDTDRVLTAGLALPSSGYPQETDRAAFWTRALDRLRALPGVEVAAIADSRPPADAGNTNNFDLEDHPTPAGQNQPVSIWVGATPGFFAAVGITLEKGRLLDSFSLRDDAIVVDRAWADRFFPGQDVVGRRLHEGGCTTCPWTTVVGVVSTVKFRGLDSPDQGTVYYPFVNLASGYLILRAPHNPASLAASLPQIVRELDPALALTSIATGDELVATSLTQPRYLSVLVGLFALTALVLSVVGVYGVMAHFVQQHTRDIGIRLALGGDPARIGRLVVGQGLKLAAIGVCVGVAAAFLTTRLMTSVLFGVTPTDLRTMTMVPAALLVVAIAACLVPARRASAVNPCDILKDT
jgi:predicted permease